MPLWALINIKVNEMRVLDLFSGIGGFSLGLEAAGMETVAFCEFDKHAQKVLAKHWPNIPIHEDVRNLDGKQYRGSVDVVCGGFPCQDLSTAGKQAGFSGERSSLYREMLRIISECLPRYAIFENVTGLLTGESGRWFGQFLYDLAEIGYDAEWHCISASELDAHHHRDRVWIIAYPKELQCNERQGDSEDCGSQVPEPGSNTSQKIPADTNLQRCERLAKVADVLQQQIKLVRSSEAARNRLRLSEPPLYRTDDGISGRTHRLKQLGNAVVPQIPEAIGRAIMAVEGEI